jgi:hypothetical protein
VKLALFTGFAVDFIPPPSASSAPRAFSPVPADALYKNLSPLKFDEPFFHGLFRKQLFLLMFDRTAGIRFTHSPSGGGYHKELQTTNPAWDFQFIIPAYNVLQESGFRARAVYRDRCSRPEIMREWTSRRDSVHEQKP